MKYMYKIIAIVFLLANNSLLFAQKGNPPPGFGTNGPGAKPQNPIDMYEIVLVIAAISLIYYFYKKSKKLKIS